MCSQEKKQNLRKWVIILKRKAKKGEISFKGGRSFHECAHKVTRRLKNEKYRAVTIYCIGIVQGNFCRIIINKAETRLIITM